MQLFAAEEADKDETEYVKEGDEYFETDGSGIVSTLTCMTSRISHDINYSISCFVFLRSRRRRNRICRRK